MVLPVLFAGFQFNKDTRGHFSSTPFSSPCFFLEPPNGANDPEKTTELTRSVFQQQGNTKIPALVRVLLYFAWTPPNSPAVLCVLPSTNCLYEMFFAGSCAGLPLCAYTSTEIVPWRVISHLSQRVNKRVGVPLLVLFRRSNLSRRSPHPVGSPWMAARPRLFFRMSVSHCILAQQLLRTQGLSGLKLVSMPFWPASRLFGRRWAKTLPDPNPPWGAEKGSGPDGLPGCWSLPKAALAAPECFLSTSLEAIPKNVHVKLCSIKFWSPNSNNK